MWYIRIEVLSHIIVDNSLEWKDCLYVDTIRRNMLVTIFLLGAALFNVMDYFLTLEVLKMGYVEWNPLIKVMIDTTFLPIIKVLIIPTILSVIWILRNRVGHRLVYYTGILFSVYFLLIIYFGMIFYRNLSL